MKKFLLLIFFFSLISHAQENTPQQRYSIAQIDSIAEINGNSLFDSSGSIIVTKKRWLIGKKVIGKGGFSDSKFYKLPSASERKLRINPPFLLKAVYHQSVKYRDGHQEVFLAEYYYADKVPFFVRLTKQLIEENTVAKENVYSISNITAIETTVIDKFDYDIKSWIIEKNEEYIKDEL